MRIMGSPRALRQAVRIALVAAIVVVCGVPSHAASPPAAGRSLADDASRAIGEMINLAHLDYLRDEISLSDGTVVPIWWVYCEPTVSGDRDSRYKYVEAASEGVSCVDDVARAALAYLADYERTGDPHDLDMVRDAFSFIEYMRTPEGHFYNFVLESGARNLKGSTSEKGVNWWTARAMWALARGVRVFSRAEPGSGYAERLEALMEPSLDAVHAFLTGGDPALFGQYKTLHGTTIPAWFVGDGADASGVVVMALCELYQARPEPRTAEMIRMFADGIAQFQMGAADESPFGAHMPWGGSISHWHGWGYHQIRALAMAGRVLGNHEWVQSAERAANSFVTHMLASIGLLAHMGPAPLTYVQLAYGCQTVTTGLLELYRATGRGIYAILAGISGSWLLGNNVAGHPMYDASTGRGWDGIDPPGPERGIGVSFNAGAESTIEAVTTLIELAGVPKACEYTNLGTRARYPFRVVEAESFDKPATGRPRKMWASWTGEGIPSGEFYVTARSGDSFKLSFSVPEDDEFVPYVVYERQAVAPGQVSLAISIDDGEPIIVDASGSPDTKYFVMEKLSDPIRLSAGRHSAAVKFAGASKSLNASIDALVFQPTVEWRHMTGPGCQNVLLARSFAGQAVTKRISVDIRKSAPAAAIEFLVSCYTAQGELARETRLSSTVAEGAETAVLDLPMEPFGYTLAEWR